MLIAEIGNNHFGDIEFAKDLIAAARMSGADIIKMQAFKAHDLTSGSMQPEFYKQCEFSLQDCIDLIYYARSIGTDLFYTILSPEYKKLSEIQNWNKLSVRAQYHLNPENYDKTNTFISFPKNKIFAGMPSLRYAKILYAGDYLTDDPELNYINILRNRYRRFVGYSCHTVGPHAAIAAVIDNGAKIIEKHFTTRKNMEFEGRVFRDTVHAADCFDLREIKNALKG